MAKILHLDERERRLAELKEQIHNEGDAVSAEIVREYEEIQIHECVIAAQKSLAALNNKIDAYDRQYDDLDSKCRIANWVKSVKGTVDQSSKQAKNNIFEQLGEFTDPIEHVVGGFIFTMSMTPGSLSIDTAKLKQQDELVFDKIAAVYPRMSSPTKRLSIKPLSKGGK